ncbi:MAG: hypothetical protein ACYCUD_12080 [Candidatus Dormibacteria bacterium]
MFNWTETAAIATGLAALATAAAASATFWMARKTSDAAAATEQDADASRQAAEAAQRLAVATESSAALARRAQDLTIRPLLADPRPALPGTPDDLVQFGAPGRPVLPVGACTFDFSRQGQVFLLTVPFENVGAGVAVIQGCGLHPRGTGDLSVSRKLVPVGTTVRVSASLLIGDETDRFASDSWAMDGVLVSITYTDADGGQPLISRAEIRQYATQAPFVERIAIFHQGEAIPFAEGRASY